MINKNNCKKSSETVKKRVSGAFVPAAAITLAVYVAANFSCYEAFAKPRSAVMTLSEAAEESSHEDSSARLKGDNE